MRVDPYNSGEAKGTVLILCVALLVLLGLAATTFVLLSHADRTGSRALSRADRFEQVRQMSLEHVRAMLLADIVDDNGKFLGSGVEAYDAPGTDAWLASHEHYDRALDLVLEDGEFWPFISKLDNTSLVRYASVGTTEVTEQELLDGGYNPDDYTNDYLTPWNSTDTDGDGVRDARWIEDDSGLPFAMLTAADGTKYRVAIRVVDTNALANINVGTAVTVPPAPEVWPDPTQWDGRYPYYMNLSALLHTTDSAAGRGSNLDDPGRVPSSPATDLHTALVGDLYPYLANPNPPHNYIRPFDAAEELALRVRPTGLDLHPRFGVLLPETFAANSDFFTAYSWTMQIRPPASPAAGIDANDIENALEGLGYPAPCKVGLRDLETNPDARRAVYLAFLAAGMTTDNAAQLLVNLIDYVDTDNDNISVVGPAGTSGCVLDFQNWGLAGTLATNGIPSSVFYGTDSQPIITEVFSYRDYDEDTSSIPYVYTRNGNCRYAVELYNPSGNDIDLSGWQLQINGGPPLSIAAGPAIPQKGYLTLVSGSITGTGESVIGSLTINAGSNTVKLLRPGPGVATVTVDRFVGNFANDPVGTPAGPTSTPYPIVEDFERPGQNTPSGAPYTPVIAPFMGPSNLHTLGTDSSTPIGTEGYGGQIVLRNGPMHSLGEVFYVPKVANDGTDAKLIEAMEGDTSTDAGYRLNLSSGQEAEKVLQYLTLRTGLYDGADNDGDGNVDDAAGGTSDDSILQEARVPGLVNINTAPAEVMNALHYYYGDGQMNIGGVFSTFRQNDPAHVTFDSLGAFAKRWKLWDSSKDEDPDGESVGSPDGITVDNEQKLFHFANVANLISVRSDTFVVYITIQASDKDGNFDPEGRTLRTMAILDRSLCLRPNSAYGQGIPLPRIVAQAVLPPDYVQ